MNVKHLAIALFSTISLSVANGATLEDEFRSPPDSARPWVYWINRDGHLTRGGITADFAAMKKAGIGGMIYMDVDVGVPRGNVPFMSRKWQENFKHAVLECERLGLEFTTITGPGWTGTGGPWIKAEQSMQHLVPSSVNTEGPRKFNKILPKPQPRVSVYHTNQTPQMRKALDAFYEDVAVYAFPRRDEVIEDISEKAFFHRQPYSSARGTRPYLPSPASYPQLDESRVIDPADIIDLTDRLQADGRLEWDVPPGQWTILRMGRRSTGANTRPAPAAGLGFESNKFDKQALDAHFEAYFDTLLKLIGPRPTDRKTGFTGLDADSWEMSAQNWTPGFREEFKKRRGYDPWPYFPAYSGRVVGSREITERFLWDVRMTCQELVLENHIGHMKELCHKRGLKLAIEPYDMNPTVDLDLGSLADIPMGEFWTNTFDTSFSCLEAASIGHVMAKPIVAAEAFTSSETFWQKAPWMLKDQGDWAFATGINRFVIVTFAHQPWLDRAPGMTFASYGLHWERTQTFWPLVHGYHQYLARCSHLLQQGVTVSDVLYLTPEGAPHVFRPPPSAQEGRELLPDKKGYGFDGCSPNILMARADVQDGRIVFPGGTSYRLMVLPRYETMTPELLAKIKDLVKAGATVVGLPPVKSPSLSNYPACDNEIRSLAKKFWGGLKTPERITRRVYGRGSIYWGGELSPTIAAKAPVLEESSWIWYPEGVPAQNAPAKTRYFKRTINVDGRKTFLSARAFITADNEFTLWINGEKVEEGDNFHIPKRKKIGRFLRPGVNVLAIAAVNLELGANPAANPAGLIAAFELNYEGGSKEVIHTDKAWRAGLKISPGWEETPDVPADWKAAVVLGGYSMPPWGLGIATPAPALYPHYDDTAALLKKMGVNEDFTATGPVRYGHRRTEEREIYFVSNKSDKRLQAYCTFRVATGRPELWNPLSGKRRPLPQHQSENGRTTIPMEFAPRESFFVVFPRGRSTTSDQSIAGGVNFPRATTVATLEGSWEVSFDPRWGGPEKVTFDTLQDWTQREEEGIKYYSGTAEYHKTFDLPAASPGGEKRLYLDLGQIKNIAEVRLNGRPLGVAWTPPWRVEITDTVKPTGNRLVITVANLWVNRLVRDSGLPAEKRLTWTTDNPYKPDSPLLPSGLLGPVSVMAEDRVK